ncbi:hypothetical protein A8M32_20865 [Sinorhizobium alkalisoli]|uniref:Uncharacterized protein n=1 Tax=Sinorhizobium alkalisoli TaxID=1752398 RepID=A0A1E3V5Y4_9HYPH|nr:hypothetical protein A8M32_20865 [Sinorhizobium alkalisoli]
MGPPVERLASVHPESQAISGGPVFATFLGAVLLWSPLDTTMRMQDACQFYLDTRDVIISKR